MVLQCIYMYVHHWQWPVSGKDVGCVRMWLYCVRSFVEGCDRVVKSSDFFIFVLLRKDRVLFGESGPV